MKRALTGILAIVVLLVVIGAGASSASASGPPTGILADASDGVVDGSYSAAQVRAALAKVRSDPAYMQYSDIEGVLVDYLASLTGTSGSGSTKNGGGTGTSSGLGAQSDQDDSSSQGGTIGSAGDSGTAEGSGGSTVSPTGSGTEAAPVPSATAWGRAKVRLAAMPWFFAAAAIGIGTGVVALLRRRRAG